MLEDEYPIYLELQNLEVEFYLNKYILYFYYYFSFFFLYLEWFLGTDDWQPCRKEKIYYIKDLLFIQALKR